MATDIFIKLGTLKGESQDDKLKDWIDVLAWSWGASHSGDAHAGGGSSSGKVSVHDFSFTKSLDISSTKSVLALCQGKHFDKIEFKARKSGESPLVFLEYTFEHCLLTSYQTGGSHGESGVTENLSFGFAKMKMKYSKQGKDGKSEADDTIGFDVKANVKTEG